MLAASMQIKYQTHGTITSSLPPSPRSPQTPLCWWQCPLNSAQGGVTERGHLSITAQGPMSLPASLSHWLPCCTPPDPKALTVVTV